MTSLCLQLQLRARMRHTALQYSAPFGAAAGTSYS
jgi:hypothetical protein